MTGFYYHTDFGKADPAEDITEFQSFRDVLKEDSVPPPPLLAKRGPYKAEPRLITYDRFIDPKLVPLEVEKIWMKYWQVACREEDIPNVGDRISYDVASLSFVVVRSGPDEFRAFYNSCRHRGRKLCDKQGSGESLQCAFHGWVYGLDGKLKWLPLKANFPNLDPEQYSLVDVKVARWGGNVFINPDPDAVPFESTLGPLNEHYADCPQGERYTAVNIRKKIRCNWKAAQDAFDEAYHVLETHADGMPIFGSALTEIDVWEGGNVHLSRLALPGVFVDPYIADRCSPQDSLKFFCSAFGFDEPPVDRGLDSADARRYAADCMRKRLEDTTGLDYSHQAPAHFLDMVKTHMFPNHHIWWGEFLPWWYRFLPYGDNPNESTMEIRVLLPIPKDGQRPPSAPVIEIGFDEMADAYPETGVLGHIADQDFRNMEAVQKGFKAAAPGTAYMTLAVDAENQITHFNEVYDKVMGFDTEA